RSASSAFHFDSMPSATATSIIVLGPLTHSVFLDLQVTQNYERVRKNSKHWANLGQFMADLPGDLRKEVEQYLKERRYDVPRNGRGKP
ncbi:MAG: hypothetical protein K2R98_31655, partial [Gemmataceae bacterium]|nr:hypothetical protein [Gemmataceae bacterium]